MSLLLYATWGLDSFCSLTPSCLRKKRIWWLRTVGPPHSRGQAEKAAGESRYDSREGCCSERNHSVVSKIHWSGLMGNALRSLFLILCCRFDSHVADDMPWEFKPTQEFVKVKPGQSTLIFFNGRPSHITFLIFRLLIALSQQLRTRATRVSLAILYTTYPLTRQQSTSTRFSVFALVSLACIHSEFSI